MRTANEIARTRYVLFDAVNDGPELQPSCWQQYVLVLQASETVNLSILIELSMTCPPDVSKIRNSLYLLLSFLFCAKRDYNHIAERQIQS